MLIMMMLSVTNISVEGNGTVTRDDETGDWTFTPDADYSGDAGLKITVNDTKVDAIFTAPVTITPEADEPSLTVSLTDMDLIDFGLGHDTALTGWHTDNAITTISKSTRIMSTAWAITVVV